MTGTMRNRYEDYKRPPMIERPGRIPCLQCDKLFNSTDVVNIRRCNPCKNKSGGSSSNNDAVFPNIPTNTGAGGGRFIGSGEIVPPRSLGHRDRHPVRPE